MEDSPLRHGRKEARRNSSTPLAKRILACQRCRDRKQKCDNVSPRCGHCVHAGKECVPQKNMKSLQQSNIDASALLRRLAFLEDKLEIRRGASVDSTPDDEIIIDSDPAGLMSKDSPTSQTLLNSVEDQVHPATMLPTPSTSSQWNAPAPLPSIVDRAPISPMSRAATYSSSAVRTRPSPNPERHNHSPMPRISVSRGLRSRKDSFVSSQMRRNSDAQDVDPFDSLSENDACSLYETYLTYIHPQYPFLCRRELDRLCGKWTHRSTSGLAIQLDGFEQCVAYMVFCIGALIFDGSTRHQPPRSEVFFAHVEKNYLPVVFSNGSLIEQTIVLLLLTMRALHDSASNAIIQHTAAAIRTAITAGLHRRASSQFGSVSEASKAEQMRRRIWWCCYGLDRTVAMVFGHPISILDDFITIEMFANVAESAPESNSRASSLDNAAQSGGDEVAVAYHLTFGRKIQSKIINTFSNPLLEQSTQLTLDRMRSQFCQELEEWQASIPVPKDKPGYGGRNWFRMVAYYSVIGLASGLNDDIRQAVGAKTVVACCNACITFQQIQRSRQIAKSWLAVLSQFQAGVTILYCFWKTPPEMRTEEFEASYASRGVRTCSNNLVLLAERWAEAEAYRDTFEVLSKVVSLNSDLPQAANRRLSPADLAELEKLVQEVKYLGTHFRAVEMIEEILYKERPVCTERIRRSVNMSYNLLPGPQSYTQSHQQGQYGGRPGEAGTLSNWDMAQAEANCAVDRYSYVPEYFGLGDPWTDRLNHSYSQH